MEGGDDFVCGDAQFCDNFERTTLMGPWDSVTSGSDLSIVADGVPGNHVLAVNIGTNATPITYLKKLFGTSVSWISYAFRLYVHADVTSYAALANLNLGEPDGTLGEVIFQMVKTGSDVFQAVNQHTQFDAGTNKGTPDVVPITMDTWTPVVIQTDLKTRTLAVYANNALVTSHPLQTTTPNWQSATGASFTLGVVTIDSTGFINPSTVVLHYDDVAITYSP